MARRAGAGTTAEERLADYRAKRDFTTTPEPEGGQPAAGERRFVVQRHRARALHYDFRLEVDGVLVSWAVPKGPTLDPKARRLAVHVEDHPIDYIDFEGVIPGGEYGGGDVIVWDRGTWTPHEPDPAAAIAAGELHADLHGHKLSGTFVLVRTEGGGRAGPGGRGGRSGGKEQWLLLHKRDEHAVPGWDPEEHPESVRSGRTNDEVAAAPEARWHSDLPAERAEERLAVAEGPSAEELEALDALGAKGTWAFDGVELRLTNLDKVLFPPGDDDSRPVTKRDLIRYHATVAPAMLPYLVGRPVNQHRYPQGVDRGGFWHKELPSHAPAWLSRWRNEEADPGETEWYVVADRPAALVWLANYAAVELHPWTSTAAHPHQPTWAMIDVDPGTASTFDDVLVLARLYRTALDHLGVVGQPKVTGQRGVQIWVPVRDGYTFDDTRGWVEKLSRAVGSTVPELVSWKWHKADRKGLARLDYTQNAINRTLVAPYSARPAPGAPVSMPITWDELDDPDLRPDRWTIRSAPDRLAEVGDLFAALLDVDQDLPAL